METTPAEKKTKDEKNFGKLTPEEQQEVSRKHMPANNDEPAINEQIALENRRKYLEEQARHTT